MAKLYFVDGYHGGVRGHMPEGSWQDILHALERWPGWKVSLEIEPESWEVLKQNDPQTYRRLQTFVLSPQSRDRVEFISGSYAQPFCWAINGESNIRQLQYGIEKIREHFPGIVIDTYAVQEPCFTSSLPQILCLLGYERMSLKNPTAWGGYMAKMPGGIVWLKGSDGSAIPAVPRYNCEELISCNATEASGYDYTAIAGFADKCVSEGVEAPVGMCLQDLGWSSAPLVQGIDVEYVTWREYFGRFGGRIKGQVLFSQDDVRVALPWGNRIFQGMLRTIRVAENRILQTEKLLAIAETEKCAGARLQGNQSRTDGRREAKPGETDLFRAKQMLKAAWKMLMQAQHHDGYICATCGDGTRQWAFRSNKLALDACAFLDHVSAAAQAAITDAGQKKEASGKREAARESEIWLRVVNTTCDRRDSQAEAVLGLPWSYQGMRVFDADGTMVPCQYSPVRQYADGGIGTVKLYFDAHLDGIGYRYYRVELCKERLEPGRGIASRSAQNLVEVKTDCLHLAFDLMRGGSIVRFLDLRSGRDYAAGVTGMGCLRGYFIEEGAFLGTQDVQAACEIQENGPLRCKLLFQGSFHGIAFCQTVIVRNHDPRFDVEVKVHFPEKTKLGYPYEPKEEERYLGTRRSSCREDYKLGVQLSWGRGELRVTKSAPFDVCESKVTDTRFDSWETIKHNVINGWVDLYQKDEQAGLAVYCDALNGYSLADNRFALTLAFGYHANFWWGCQLAEGNYTLGYSLMPHTGGWEEGKVSLEDARLREPLIVQRMPEKPERAGRALLYCEEDSVEAVTVLTGKECLARLFHAGTGTEALHLGGELAGCVRACTDLNGQDLEKSVREVGPFEIKTLRCGDQNGTYFFYGKCTPDGAL